MFEVGDIVIGIPGSAEVYRVTNEFSVCEVIGVFSSNRIDVEVQSNEDGRSIGKKFRVNSEWFQLLTPRVSLTAQTEAEFAEMIG